MESKWVCIKETEFVLRFKKFNVGDVSEDVIFEEKYGNKTVDVKINGVWFYFYEEDFKEYFKEVK